MTQDGIPQQVWDRLDALAAKLGTTAEQAWPLLVERVVAGGLMVVTLGAAMLLCSAVFGILCARTDPNDRDDSPFLCGVVVASVSAVLGGIAVALGLPIILAPEGHAIGKLLGWYP